MKRIFIVGIARSGTTLLQSFLGAHSDVYTFPESHFFRSSIPNNKYLRPFHKIKDSDTQRVSAFLNEIGKSEHFKPYKLNRRDLKSWGNYLLETFDRMAKAEKKDIWLEKTPMHLRYIDLIEKIDSDIQFIHSIRNPIENIAGLLDASKKHPDSFSQTSLEKAIKRYLIDIKISNKYRNLKNHHIVYYEELVQKSESVLKELCKKLKLSFEISMLNHTKAMNQITQNEEIWKQNNFNKIELKEKRKDRITVKEELEIRKRIPLHKFEILNYYE